MSRCSCSISRSRSTAYPASRRQGSRTERPRCGSRARPRRRTRPRAPQIAVSSMAKKGFRLNYAAREVETSGFLDTGGAIIDPKTGKIHGVVSGVGKDSGLSHIARVDSFAKWMTKATTCVSTSSGLGTRTNPDNGGSSGSSGEHGAAARRRRLGWLRRRAATELDARRPSSPDGRLRRARRRLGHASGSSSGSSGTGSSGSSGNAGGGIDTSGSDSKCPGVPSCDGGDYSGRTAPAGRQRRPRLVDGTSDDRAGRAGRAAPPGGRAARAARAARPARPSDEVCPGPPNCPEPDNQACAGAACGGCGGVMRLRRRHDRLRQLRLVRGARGHRRSSPVRALGLARRAAGARPSRCAPPRAPRPHAALRAPRPDPALRHARRRGPRGARRAHDGASFQGGREGLRQGRRGLEHVHRALGRGADLPARRDKDDAAASSSRTCARASTSASSRSSTTSRARRASKPRSTPSLLELTREELRRAPRAARRTRR